MTKTKIILIALAISLMMMTAIGVTYAQYFNTQDQSSSHSQTPTQAFGGNYGDMFLTMVMSSLNIHIKVLILTEWGLVEKI